MVRAIDNRSLGGDYSVYGYLLNENARLVHYGSNPSVADPRNYQTDVFSRIADGFIRRRAPTGQPFFLYLAPNRTSSRARATARGTTPRAPPRYEGRFAGLPARATARLQRGGRLRQAGGYREAPAAGPHQKAEIDALYRAQARSLLAVDDLVQNVVRTLKQEGVLNNTVILFTSDNGFLHGEHRVLQGKVPAVRTVDPRASGIRAPGVPEGVHRRQLVENVDLTPTILDFAHANPGRVQDGQSLVLIMRQPRYSPGRGLELEAWATRRGRARQTIHRSSSRACARTVTCTPVRLRRAGAYDLREDPFELRNAANDPAYARVRASLHSLLGVLGDCAGETCRATPDLHLQVPSCSSALVTGSGDIARGDLLSGRQEDRQRLEAADPDQLPRHGRRRASRRWRPRSTGAWSASCGG